MQNKVKAFTVVELAVAMLITAVVLTIAYNSMDIFGKLSGRFYQNQKKNSEILQFDRLLKMDMARSVRVQKAGNGIVCISHKTVTYEWYPEYVLRNSAGVRADTLYVSHSGLTFFFQGNEQQEEAGLIDQVLMIRRNGDQEQALVYAADIAPDALVNAGEQ